MKKVNICIIGSTGKLGSKLLIYCNKNKININCITYYSNKKKAINLKRKYKIENCFSLKNILEKNKFIEYLKTNKLDIIYFLDCGIHSLIYADIFLKNNKNSYISIANKEMIIGGGSLLINKIEKTRNILIPLDSEHFSLLNSNLNESIANIDKVYLTASGGPFYFDKKINLHNVSLKQVLNHPKWKMGINNSIDSSNFINKLLEMYELSIIYKIDLKKISFLISKNAFIHSVIRYKDQTISLNCFENDMLITLIKPLSYFYNTKISSKKSKIFDLNNFKLEEFKDNRFQINILKNQFMKLNHEGILRFVILNNIAQKKYLNKRLSYQNMIPFIKNNLKTTKEKINFKSFDDVLFFLQKINREYENI